MSQRPEVAAAGRVVLKVGTRVLTDDEGRLALSRLYAIVETAARLVSTGRDVLVVSSGAVGLGRQALGLDAAPDDLADRQACAAIGQARLMEYYHAGFRHHGIVCGQVLLTHRDFDGRLRYLNLRSTLSALLRRRAVPIINENDAVSTEELVYLDTGPHGRPVFGDNDRLAALVAVKLDADLLVLLTDVAGVHDRDPRRHPDARLRTTIEDAGEAGVEAGASTSGLGRGGMARKIEAARDSVRGGCPVVIASGLEPGALEGVLAGDEVGTYFPAPREGRLGARRSWIAFGVATRGALHLDAGAVAAIRERGASLLAAGVARCDGDFEAGDVVELIAPDGAAIGRGMVHCGADEARAWREGRPPTGVRNHHALVHRDHLVLTGPETASTKHEGDS